MGVRPAVLFAAFATLSLPLAPVLAVADWLPNGNVVHAPSLVQYKPHLAPDGRGGAFAISSTGATAYADHFAADGDVARGFPATSVLVPPASIYAGGEHYRVDPVAAVADGQGGCYVITFAGARCRYKCGGDPGQLYVSRLSADGDVAGGWPADGSPVALAFVGVSIGERGRLWAESDGPHGVAIAWTTGSDAPNRLFVQSVAADGTRRWGDDGLELAPAWSYHTSPAVLPDGQGGALVFWGGRKTSQLEGTVMGQHVGRDGRLLWGAEGLVISRATTRGPGTVQAVSDGNGGAIVGWNGSSGAEDLSVFAARISRRGELLWPEDLRLAGGSGHQDQLRMTATVGGGAIAVWRDGRLASGRSIYAQRVTRRGQLAWDRAGVPVATGTADKDIPAIVEDGSGGAYIAWSDLRPDGELFATRLDGRGMPERGWPESGTIVSQWPKPTEGSSIYRVSDLKMIATGRGESILEWTDSRGPIEQTLVTLLTRDGPAAPPADGTPAPPAVVVNLVSVPAIGARPFALRGIGPNPSTGGAFVTFALPDARPATIEVFDIAGRRVWSRDVDGFGPGEHSVRLFGGAWAPAGVYLLRLIQGVRVAVSRFTLVR